MQTDNVHAVLKPTREYSSFSFHHLNRLPTPAQVDRLEESTETLQLLDLYPIVTTMERVIDDGQHRFQMARNLMIPFYFIASSQVQIEDVRIANEQTLSYSEDDAFHVYSRLGLTPYCVLNDFLQKNEDVCGWKVSRPAGWMYSKYNKSDFVHGEFAVDRSAWAQSLADAISDLAKLNPQVVHYKPYHDALKDLLGLSVYDHRRMIDRATVVPSRLIRCGKKSEALRILEDIYNYNIRGQNKMDFVTAIKFHRAEPAQHSPIENQLDTPCREIDARKETLVYCSDDYGAFSIHPAARVCRGVDTLADFIQRKNMLECYPIIVDSNYRIIDGQRRYEAARRLGLPIYYIKSDNFSIWMATIAGALRRDWRLSDYLDSYVKEGAVEYVWLRDFMKRYPVLTPGLFIRLHSGAGPGQRKRFKRGEFTVDRTYMTALMKGWSCLGKSSHKKNSILLIATASICGYGKNMDRLSRVVHVLNRDTSGLLDYAVPLPYATDILVDMYNRNIHASGRIRRPA